MKRLCGVAFALLPALAWAGPGDPHFSVDARFVPPAKRGATAVIAVHFKALSPDVWINEEPAPRLKLADQEMLIYNPPAGAMSPPNFDPAFAKYLDLAKPVSFPVIRAANAPQRPQAVKGTAVYFYCSKKEGWCKKGSSDFEVTASW